MREFFKFIARVLSKILYRIKIIGIENIPKDESAIICPNHVHAFDGPITISYIKRKIHVFARDGIFKTKFEKWFAKICLIHIIKRDSADIHAIKLSMQLLKDNQLLMIFPEGTRNGMAKGVKAKNGAVTIAMRTGAPVIPVGIKGNFKLFKKVIITIGKPISYENYKDKIKDKEVINSLTQELMNTIVSLRDS